MKFKNLDQNILYRLDEELKHTRFQNALHPEVIYRAFADIPDSNITEALGSLKNRGLIGLDQNARKLFLTVPGKDAVRKFGRPLEKRQE
jgi:hypothetical protein